MLARSPLQQCAERTRMDFYHYELLLWTQWNHLEDEKVSKAKAHEYFHHQHVQGKCGQSIAFIDHPLIKKVIHLFLMPFQRSVVHETSVGTWLGWNKWRSQIFRH